MGTMKKRVLDQETTAILEEHALWLQSRFRKGMRACLVGAELQGVSLTGLSKTKRTGAVKNDDRVDWGDTNSLFPGDIAYI
jgi:hypothetical protein